MAENTEKKAKKSFFESPIMRSAVKSANTKIFPEGGLGYFIGPTFALLANSILSSNYNRYMSDVLKISTWGNWGSIIFQWLPVISVVFVVLGNILIGRLMDRCKTKAGKSRPLLLLALPIMLLALLLLFIVFPFPGDDGTKQIVAVVCIMFGYNIWFGFAYPFYYTPHASLVNLSTRNSKDRGLLATISNATSLAAMGLSSMILPYLNGYLFASKVSVETSFSIWYWIAIGLVILAAIGVIMEFYFTRERVTEESFNNATAEEVKKVPLIEQVKVCFKDKYWWIMVAFFFLYQLGGLLKNTSQTYYCMLMFSDAEGTFNSQIGGNYQGTLSIIGAIPTAIGMVLAWPLSNKIGKGKAILCGAILAAVGGAIGFIAPTNFYVVTTSFVIKALGSTPAMYLSLALLADTLDHQEAMHGIRTDGFTMTVYGAIMAGMTGIATGILNMVLSSLDYNSHLTEKMVENAEGVLEKVQFIDYTNVVPANIQVAMGGLFIGGETLCYLVIAIVFIFMGVEKFGKFDFKAIVKDQRAKALAEGKSYVDPKTALKLQEEESNEQAEQRRIEALKAKCEKNNLNFEEENAKVLKAREDKKAAAEAKKAAKEAAKQAKLDAMTPEQRAAYEQKLAAKAEKQLKRDTARLEEFNKLRSAMGRTEVTLEDEDVPVEETTPVAPDAEPSTTEIDNVTDSSREGDDTQENKDGAIE